MKGEKNVGWQPETQPKGKPQVEKTKGAETMKKYICKEVPTDNGGYLEIETELIRCKDCKYRITANCERFGIKRYTQSDSFCSWAEPKDTTEEVRKQLKDMEQRRKMDRKK